MAKPIRESSRKSKKGFAYPIVFIVCEGKVTEPTYFKHFKELRHKPVRIVIVTGAAGKSYSALINKAVEARVDLYNAESELTVWCVSDVDVDSKAPNNQSSRKVSSRRS